jgi:hypothetical protein
MIISKIQGGLGNQLFQWATAKAFSLRNNCEYKFEISFYYEQTFRRFELHKFNNIKINILSPDNLKNKKIIYVNENEIKDFNIPFEKDYCIFLNGYWQNEKYFKDQEIEIKNTLKIPEDLKTYIYKKYPILNENTVSIHVRRTDYLSLSGYHYNQDLNYYNNSFDILNDKDINVLVFSDDIKWCKENLKFNNTYYIEGEENKIDLYIMSLCKNNIIANSTFSWWSAWLNDNPSKQIIAPKNWFGEQGPKNIKVPLDNWTIL